MLYNIYLHLAIANIQVLHSIFIKCWEVLCEYMLIYLHLFLFLLCTNEEIMEKQAFELI